jgi:hypothetical protein
MHLLTVRKEPEIIIDDSEFDSSPTPEKKLVKAIIGRATCDILNQTKEVDKKRIKREASAWIFSNCNKQWSFFWCCEIADLDPWRIRNHIISFLKQSKKRK